MAAAHGPAVASAVSEAVWAMGARVPPPLLLIGMGSLPNAVGVGLMAHEQVTWVLTDSFLMREHRQWLARLQTLDPVAIPQVGRLRDRGLPLHPRGRRVRRVGVFN